MDALDSVFDPLRDFAKDSVRLVKRCHKPDRKGNAPLNLILASCFWGGVVEEREFYLIF